MHVSWCNGNRFSAFQIIQLLNVPSLIRSFASTFHLFPHPSVWNDTVVVATPTRNYTANDYQQLFNDIGYPEGYTRLSHNDEEWPAPNVPTYCFYSLEYPTPVAIVYDAEFPNTQPISIIFGDGDSAVPKPGLEVCLRWVNSGYPFNRTIFKNSNHANLTTNKEVFQTIGSIVGAPMNTINGMPLTTYTKST